MAYSSFNPRMSGAMMPLQRQQLIPHPFRGDPHKQALIPTGPRRTSSLDAPIMRLFGHEGEIFSAKFSPDGGSLASGSYERLIYLWKVYGECENYCVLKGHQGAIMEIQYSADGTMLFSVSTDKLGAVWDVEVGERIKKLKGHSSIVNSCGASRKGSQIVCTGSDDGTVRVWDLRSRYSSQTFNNIYQVTSVCFGDSSEQVISGGIDNIIKIWDTRKEEVLYTLSGHTDTVTGLSVSQNGSYLLSNAMDNTVRLWDIRAYAPNVRQLKLLLGAQHNFEKNLLRCCWSPDGRKVAAGSADRYVYVWDAVMGNLLYKLPGHQGSINDVDFHPKEPILLSCSSDKTIYLGELQ